MTAVLKKSKICCFVTNDVSKNFENEVATVRIGVEIKIENTFFNKNAYQHCVTPHLILWLHSFTLIWRLYDPTLIILVNFS